MGTQEQELRRKWDQRYREAGSVAPPAEVLVANAHLLPRQGLALDMACGLGANALFLAQQGLDVRAWDLSAIALDHLRQEAQARGLTLALEARDVLADPPAAESFDLILVSHFLERSLADAIMAALKPGGLLFYQTFSQEAVSAQGPSNPAYRLAANELLRLFSPMLIRVYRDEGRVGDVSAGFRDRAYLVAQKPG